MKRNLLIAIVIMCAGTCGCFFKKNKDTATLQVIEDKGNSPIKDDDFVSVNYTVKTTDGQVVYDNYDHTMFRGRSDFKGDFFNSLGLLGEGDSAIVKVSIDSLKARNHVLPASVSGKYLVYYIRINKVITRQGKPNRITDSLLNANIENSQKAIVENDKKKEAGRFNQYIIRHQLKPISTPSGLNYVIKQIGTGPMPKPGDLSQIYFTGKYVDGEVFFTNNKADAITAGIYQAGKKYEPLDMYIGKHFFIRGLEEGLLLFPAGTKATLIIPSKLSNGERYGYVPLLCEVQVLNVRKPKPGEKIKMLHGDSD
jgi:FKBP-type peptidyl-prolyl cis-trans isomerase FkpA